jgi:hypothetical protein
LLIVGLVSLPLASGITAQDEGSEYRGIRKRLAALEYKLQYIDGGPNEVVITGANLRIVNGLGSTLTTNGLGNLIVGYNESREPFEPDVRTGSHNVIVGEFHNFSSFAGIAVGGRHEISNIFASLVGGVVNTASGDGASVFGGDRNTASGTLATVCGSDLSTASGNFSSVSGGAANTASGPFASVSGGRENTASGFAASVSGGEKNTASGSFSSVSGGLQRTAPGDNNWAAGPLFAAQ